MWSREATVCMWDTPALRGVEESKTRAGWAPRAKVRAAERPAGPAPMMRAVKIVGGVGGRGGIVAVVVGGMMVSMVGVVVGLVGGMVTRMGVGVVVDTFSTFI